MTCTQSQSVLPWPNHLCWLTVDFSQAAQALRDAEVPQAGAETQRSKAEHGTAVLEASCETPSIGHLAATACARQQQACSRYVKLWQRSLSHHKGATSGNTALQMPDVAIALACMLEG